MSAKIIDGRAIAEEIKARVAAEASALRERGRPPCLTAVLIGDDDAAANYAASQARHAASVGLSHRLVRLPVDTSPSVAAAQIRKLNDDPAVSGIMLHLPVPEQLDAFLLQQAIDVSKDVEGIGAANLGRLTLGREALVPCTAAAAFACLKSTGIDLAGKEAVVVGRSVIVGKPLAMLLLGAHATVTQCHTRTRDLAAHTRRAEVLVVAAGVAGMISAEHVTLGCTVIDVGTHRVTVTDDEGRAKKKTIGDVRFDEVSEVAAAITPVPGGVGPVTVAMLLENTVTACRREVVSRG